VPWSDERRAAQSKRMRENNPMRQPGVAARVAASRSKPLGALPCPEGCTCARHDSNARRAAVETRWATATSSDRARQAEVMRSNALEYHAQLRAEFAECAATAYDNVIPPPEVEPVHGLDQHRAMAKKLGIHVVGAATLRKYGLTELEWLEMLAAQGWKCPVCGRRVARYNTDHEHVPTWKLKTPQERKVFVRGILCAYDNYRMVPSLLNAETAQRMAVYLHRYEKRRQECLSGLM
jgi:hypothetical protein